MQQKSMKILEYHRMARVSKQHWWYLSKRRLLKNILDKFFDGQKKRRQILDIGSGTGSNWQVLKQYGQVTGVEQSAIGVAYCKNLGWKKIIQGNANKLNFKNNSFDLITILDVLYHREIKSDLLVLAKIHKILKPGGLLLVTDCAGPKWFGPHDKINFARERYTLSELASKLEKTGFKIKLARYFYFLTYPLFVLTRLLQKFNLIDVNNSENLPPKIINWLLTKILEFEADILITWSLPIGSSVIFLVQKPA